MRQGIVGVVVITFTAACADITQPEPDDAGADVASATSKTWLANPLQTTGDGFAVAEAINAAGTVVGWVTIAPGETRAVRWQRGELTELPGLGGGSSAAEDINDRGDIAGWALDPSGASHAVLWRDGVPLDLGTLGGEFSFALGINNRGQVVGASETSTGHVNAFLWTAGEMVDLGRLPDSDFAWAHDLNERGEVVGWSSGVQIFQTPTYWFQGRIEALPSLGWEAAASDINNRGDIVGGSFKPGGVWALAVIWEKGGGIRELGTLGEEFSTANAINDRGQVVGASASPDCYQCPVLWDRGAIVNLGSGSGVASAHDINNGGDIVGRDGGPMQWSAAPASWAARFPTRTLRLPSRDARAARPDADAEWAGAVCAAGDRVDRGPSALRIVARC